MIISSFCFYRMTNRYTFNINFGRDMVDPDDEAKYRSRVADLVEGYLRQGAPTQPVPDFVDVILR